MSVSRTLEPTAPGVQLETMALISLSISLSQSGHEERGTVDEGRGLGHGLVLPSRVVQQHNDSRGAERQSADGQGRTGKVRGS